MQGDNNFLKNITDIVLIHAYKRQQFLFSQIISFIKSQFNYKCTCKITHRILFVIVDDSCDKKTEKAYKHEVKGVAIYLNNEGLANRVYIDYWGKGRQKRLLKTLKLSKGEEKIFFKDAVSGKLGGVRAIQNISQIIADYYCGFNVNPADVIIHKLDDDIFPVVMSYRGNKIYQIQLIKLFFCKKRLFFKSKQKARMAASYYTIDSPSNIVDLFEIIEAIYLIFKQIKIKEIKSDKFTWNNIKNRLYLYGTPKKIITKNLPASLKRLTNLEYLKKTDRLSVLFIQIRKYLVLFNNGVNRFEYNLSNFANKTNWYTSRELIPGGCISYFASEKISSFPNFASQDILWSCLEYNKKQGIYGDFAIGHLKTGLIRSGLLDDLFKNEEELRCDFAITFYAINLIKNELNHGYIPHIGINDLFEFSSFGKNILPKTCQRLKYILKLLDIIIIMSKSNKKLQEETLKIKKILSPILKNYNLIRRRYEEKRTNINKNRLKTRVINWINSQKKWGILRERAVTIIKSPRPL